MKSLELQNATRRKLMSGAAIGALLPAEAWSQLPKPGQDVIVLIPGITGSVLSIRGREIWSPEREGIITALFTLGESLTSLKLEHDPTDRFTLDDGVVANRLVEDVHLIPGLWKIDGYTKLINRLSAQPGVRRGENFFQFPYDWRRDNRVSAKRLQLNAHKWLSEWRSRTGNPNAKLVFLAHSMGGLIARYFIECLGGWEDTRRLISFGTPYGGAVNSLRFLYHGMGLNLRQTRLLDLTELLRSFNSVYQLLPVYACIESVGQVKRIHEVGPIPNIDSARVANARLFHEEIATAVKANENLPGYSNNRYQIHPIVGVGQNTAQYVKKHGPSLSFTNEFPSDTTDGDGTVPQPSATPLELRGKDIELFEIESHSSLQNSAHVFTQISKLIDSTRRNWEAYRSEKNRSKTSFDVPDAIFENEKIILSGQIDPSEYSDVIQIEIRDSSSTGGIDKIGITANPTGLFRTELTPIKAGTYRITAKFSRRQTPDRVSVTDVMCVLPIKL